MQGLRHACATFIAAFGVSGAAGVCAQSYPSKPIRILTTEIGSASDLAARLMAKELQASLGQSVVVENRALIGVELVTQAPADGHTLLHYTSPLWIIPLFRSSVAWDVGRDFTPVACFMACHCWDRNGTVFVLAIGGRKESGYGRESP